jgi:phosphatidylglycerol---prolipoprotein diacylglyceryl transferase
VIPYFEQPSLSLGPITIHLFGALLAVAILAGQAIMRRRALATGIDRKVADHLLGWVLVCGFLGAHLVDRLVYFPRQTWEDPLSLLKVWEGISSFGGFLGAVVGAALFVRRAGLGEASWRYLDAVAYAFPFGWIFGRLGCFVAFDHPGLPTSIFLGQMYKDGLVRHNLGLEEALFTIPLAALFLLLGKRPRAPGFFVGLLPILYAPFRFLTDFLRIVDVRYLGLTPGQWGALGLVVVGAMILRRVKKQDAAAPHRAAEAESPISSRIA